MGPSGIDSTQHGLGGPVLCRVSICSRRPSRQRNSCSMLVLKERRAADTAMPML